MYVKVNKRCLGFPEFSLIFNVDELGEVLIIALASLRVFFSCGWMGIGTDLSSIKMKALSKTAPQNGRCIFSDSSGLENHAQKRRERPDSQIQRVEHGRLEQPCPGARYLMLNFAIVTRDT